jgi:hypothetical protein
MKSWEFLRDGLDSAKRDDNPTCKIVTMLTELYEVCSSVINHFLPLGRSSQRHTVSLGVHGEA